MSKKPSVVCAGCQGVISGTRRFPLSTSIATHIKTCPSRVHATATDKEKK